MHESYVEVAETVTGMVLGSGSWLEAVARDADLAYGFAHRPLGLASQSWFTPPGQGEFNAWEGVTVYDAQQVTLDFSAWVEVATGGWAKLQLYYAAAWHDFVSDANAGSHWFDDAHDTAGVISYDISAHYTDGDVVRARLRVNGDGATTVTTGAEYRAVLGGTTGFPTWPTWPTWTTASAHSAANFNTLRTGAMYLKDCAEQPVIGTEKGDAYGDNELFRWSFRMGGQQWMHLTITTMDCDASNAIEVYIQDEQYPHGSHGASRTALLGSWINNAAQTLDVDLSAYTKGTYYCITVVRNAAGGAPRAEVTSLWLRDLAALTRTTTPGSFAYADRPTITTASAGHPRIDLLSLDMEAMKPTTSRASPLWYEHAFATVRGMNQQHYQVSPGTQPYIFPVHHWGICHSYDYLYYAGAGRIVSSDGSYVYSLSDSNPAGQVQVLEMKALTWLAKGDRYTAEDSGTGQLLVAFEHWEA